MIKRRMTPIILILVTLFALAGTAAAFTGTGISGDPYVVESTDTDLSGWTTIAEGDYIRVENTSLLPNVISSIANNSTIILINGPYAASQFFIPSTKEGITITNNAGTAPEIQLTAVSDGFKIWSNRTTITNVTLNGTGVANYGFRVQIDYVNDTGGHNITFDNVTARNMVKTAFDFSRNTDCSFTNLTAENNGGFGITINQGSNVTVSGNTSNNSWGGLNVNNKNFTDGTNIATAGINVSGINLTEQLPVVIEEYDNAARTTVRTLIGASLEINLTNDSIIITNNNSTGINDDSIPILGKIMILNPNNTADQNGAILAGILGDTGAEDGNQVNVPPGTYNVGNVTVPTNMTIVGSGNPTIVGVLTPADSNVTIGEENVTVTPTAPSSGGSGGGYGSATVVNTTMTNNTTNATNTTNTTNTTPSNTSNTSSNTSTNTSTNNTSTPSSSESWWDKYMWYVIGAAAVIIIIGAGAYYYFYMYKPKNP
ncbi:right-handed parallel beta-helix repeat-containing protein [Methanolapillus millepedarum]|uniref:Right handed beta helix domain-containing protein n=1 Tax=Methanolapillus millepedarum TaxID=3028296 RepID=A0AA96V6F6_9EURY|nr:hypothetical protein MsAc7_15550 [Methanosarcinaceae archaeon Ac7]